MARATSTAALWTRLLLAAIVCVTWPATRKSARSSMRSCFQMILFCLRSLNVRARPMIRR